MRTVSDGLLQMGVDIALLYGIIKETKGNKMRLLEIAMWWMITVLYCFVPSAIILYGSAILTHYILHG